jgi:flavin reductase (DIM6/NTAB) family NADH-FMN oxidoreductase RutF
MGEGFACIDPQSLSAKENYFLLTSLVVPRPIAWVSTVDASGIPNLAPFSYFNGVCSDPPTISISIADTSKGPKDTFRAMVETQTFCINLVEEQHAQAMHVTSGAFAAEQSEFEIANLKTVECTQIQGLRVADARASLECRLIDVHTYGRKAKCNLVIGEVVQIHVSKELMHDRRLMADQQKIKPVGRLGGGFYSQLQSPYQLPPVNVELLSKEKMT